MTHLHCKSLVLEKQVHYVCLWDTMKKGRMVYVCSDYDTELIRARVSLGSITAKGRVSEKKTSGKLFSFLFKRGNFILKKFLIHFLPGLTHFGK